MTPSRRFVPRALGALVFAGALGVLGGFIYSDAQAGETDKPAAAPVEGKKELENPPTAKPQPPAKQTPKKKVARKVDFGKYEDY